MTDWFKGYLNRTDQEVTLKSNITHGSSSSIDILKGNRSHCIRKNDNFFQQVCMIMDPQCSTVVRQAIALKSSLLLAQLNLKSFCRFYETNSSMFSGYSIIEKCNDFSINLVKDQFNVNLMLLQFAFDLRTCHRRSIYLNDIKYANTQSNIMLHRIDNEPYFSMVDLNSSSFNDFTSYAMITPRFQAPSYRSPPYKSPKLASPMDTYPWALFAYSCLTGHSERPSTMEKLINTLEISLGSKSAAQAASNLLGRILFMESPEILEESQLGLPIVNFEQICDHKYWDILKSLGMDCDTPTKPLIVPKISLNLVVFKDLTSNPDISLHKLQPLLLDEWKFKELNDIILSHGEYYLTTACLA